MAKSISIPITGNAAPLRRALANASDDVSRFGSKVGGAFRTLGKIAAVGAGAAAAGAVAFGKAAFDAAEAAGTSNARILNVAESMGLFGTEAAKVSDRLIALAEDSARLTGVNQNTIKESQALLLTFGEVAATADDVGGSFDRATKLTLDLAAAGFGSATDNAKQLGKALNDPVKGITALTRSGVTFTQEQKDLIESLVESGQMLEAQDLILTEIEKQVGGTAEATANASDIIKVGFSQITERVGTALLPVFEKLTGFVLDTMLPGIEKLIDVFDEGGLGGVVKYVGDAIRAAIPGVLGQLWEWAQALGAWLVDTGLPWIGEKLAELGQALVDWIRPRIRPMLEQLGALIAAAAQWVLDDGLPMLVDRLVRLGDALVAWIQPNIRPMLGKLGDFLVAALDWIVTEALPKLTAQAAKLAGALIGWIVDVAPGVLLGLGEMLLKVGGWLATEGVPKLKAFGKDLATGLLDGIVNALGSLASGASGVARQVVNAIIRFVNSQIIDRVNRAVEFTIDLPLVPAFHVNPPDIPRIPMLAAGGLVTQPTLAGIGEAGPEAVIPLDRLHEFGGGGGGGTVNITVNMPTGSDGADVVRALQTYARQNGNIPLPISSLVRV